MNAVIERETFQKGYLTGWCDPEHYVQGAILRLTFKDYSKATERSILIERRDNHFVLLPCKSPWWVGEKSCNFVITNECNIFVAISAAEGVLLDESIWTGTGWFVV